MDPLRWEVMLTRYAIVLCLFGTACATDDYDGGRQGGRSLQKELCPTGCTDDVSRALATSDWWEDVGGNAYVSSPPGEIAFEPACKIVPNEGLCAFACNTEALAKNIAAGTCTTIACGLSDGRTLVASACNDFSTVLAPY